MKKNSLIRNLVFAIEKTMEEMEGEYTSITIEKNTIFSNYKIEIKKN